MSKKKKPPTQQVNDVNDREPKAASQAMLNAVYGKMPGFRGKLD